MSFEFCVVSKKFSNVCVKMIIQDACWPTKEIEENRNDNMTHSTIKCNVEV